jgi:hypothetical protein
MDDVAVYRQALELLSQDYGSLAARWKITQAQALGLQDELRRALARVQELEAQLGSDDDAPDDDPADDED